MRLARTVRPRHRCPRRPALRGCARAFGDTLLQMRTPTILLLLACAGVACGKPASGSRSGPAGRQARLTVAELVQRRPECRPARLQPASSWRPDTLPTVDGRRLTFQRPPSLVRDRSGSVARDGGYAWHGPASSLGSLLVATPDERWTYISHGQRRDGTPAAEECRISLLERWASVSLFPGTMVSLTSQGAGPTTTSFHFIVSVPVGDSAGLRLEGHAPSVPQRDSLLAAVGSLRLAPDP